eukprot:907030-Rhodomonas_salina.7
MPGTYLGHDATRNEGCEAQGALLPLAAVPGEPRHLPLRAGRCRRGLRRAWRALLWGAARLRCALLGPDSARCGATRRFGRACDGPAGHGDISVDPQVAHSRAACAFSVRGPTLTRGAGAAPGSSGTDQGPTATSRRCTR